MGRCSYHNSPLSDPSQLIEMNSIAIKSFVRLQQSSLEKPHFATHAKHFTLRPEFKVVAGQTSPKLLGRNFWVAIVGGCPAVSGGVIPFYMREGGMGELQCKGKMSFRQEIQFKRFIGLS